MIARTIFLLNLVAIAGGAADLSAQNEGQSLLLLRNGQTLEGRISRDGDRYVVTVENGEMRIPARDVDFQCETLQQAYQTQSNRISPQETDQRLRLAEWCLRHELVESAASEIAAVKLLDARQSGIQLLERRLEECRKARDELPRTNGFSDNQTSSAAGKQSATRLKTSTNIASEDLEQFARGLPTGTVEFFSRTIQPLLLAHCGTAGCHGAGGKSDFVLLRPSQGSGVARRVTLRNIHTLMQWIDHDQPADSKLVEMARRPHDVPSDAVAQTQNPPDVEQLQAWVMLATRGNKTAQRVPDTVATPRDRQLGQTVPPTAPTNHGITSLSKAVNAYPEGAGWRNAIAPSRPAVRPKSLAPVPLASAESKDTAPSKKTPILDKPSTPQTPADIGIAPMPPLPDEATKDAKESAPLQSEKAPHAGFDPNAFRPEFKGKAKQ